MERERNNDIDELYSTLNIGSFLERRKSRETTEENIPRRRSEELKQERPVTREVSRESLRQEKPVAREVSREALRQEKPVAREVSREALRQEKPITREVSRGALRQQRPVAREVSRGALRQEKPVAREVSRETLRQEKPITREANVRQGKTIAQEEPQAVSVSELRRRILEQARKEEELKSEKAVEEAIKREKPLLEEVETIEPVVTEEELEDLTKEFEESNEELDDDFEDLLDSKKKKRKKEKKGKNRKESDHSKMSKKLFAGVITCAILDVIAVVCLFLVYGPISYFRNMLVTSAMTTMNHKYLARTFYSEKTINQILAGNVVNEIGENTNIKDINFNGAEDTGKYDSVYEEQILKRDKNQLYKVIDIKGNGYVGYLVAIYDPSRVELVSATSYGYGGALLTNMSKKYSAKVAINASGFSNGTAVGKGSIPVGTVIQDGKIISNGSVTGYGGGIAGFNKDHVLVLTKEDASTAVKNGIVDAVEFGPFLIVNGKAAEIKGNGGWGIAPRTVLAQRKDGIVLFLVIDGRNAKHSLGVDMNELINILTKYKAHNAVNLDGGGSSTLVVEGKLKNIPCGSSCGERYVPNAWIVK